jgi:hypothetical protein
MSKSIAVCCCECHNSLACLIVFYAALYQTPSVSPAELNAKLFADDCLLHREVNTTSDTNKLQEDLDMLQKWESKWQMVFNADKCFENVLLFFALVLCPQSDLCYEDPSIWMHIPMWVLPL